MSEAPSEATSRRENLFDASHLRENLNARLAKSGVITLSTQAVKMLLRIGSMAVLARLLRPEDFGLIAMVTVVTGFLEMFKDAGLSMATIQREEITRGQVSTLFWLNVALGTALMVVQAGLAPVLGWFYGEPRLVAVGWVLACCAVFGGMSVQHQALLRRNMLFGRLAAVDLVSSAIGVGFGAAMAWHGFGYWALVGMTVATSVCSAVLTFMACQWVPGLPARGQGVRPMVRFGGNLAGAGFFNYLISSSDNFIIGAMHGPQQLGVYGRAYSLFLAPMQQFLAPISGVVIPALSRTVREPERFRRMFLEKSYFVLFFVVLATGFSFLAAPELVRILLGPGWDLAVPVVRCLAIGGAISGTNVVGGWVSATHGWSRRQLNVAMIAGPIYALAFYAGSHYGIIGVACAFSATCALLRYPVFRYLLAGSPATPWDLIRPLLQVGGIVAVAALASLAVVGWIAPLGLLATLGLKAVVFAGVLAVFLWLRLLKLPEVSRIG